VLELVDIAALTRLAHVVVRGQRLGIAARPDFVAALAAMFGVLVFDTLPGLVIGIVCSLVLLVYRASRPRVSELARSPGEPHRWTDVARNPDDERVPGIVVLRVEAGLFFANADFVRSVVRKSAARKGTRAVVIDAQTVAFIDVTAADMLVTLSEELAALGVVLVVAHDVGQVRDTLHETGLEDSIGGRIYATVDQAIEALTGAGSSGAPAG